MTEIPSFEPFYDVAVRRSAPRLTVQEFLWFKAAILGIPLAFLLGAIFGLTVRWTCSPLIQ